MFKNLREDKQILYSIIAGISILLLIVIAMIWAQRSQSTAQKELVNALELEHALQAILAKVSETETGQRGFLLTLEDKYLDSYYSGGASTQQAIDKIQKNVELNPRQEKRFANIRSLVSKKFGEMTVSIKMAEEGKVEEAVNYVKTDYGKLLMDSIRLEIGETIEKQNDIVEQSRINAKNRYEASNIFGLAGVLLILLIAYLVYSIVRPVVLELVESRDREHLHNEALAEKNEELEHFAYIASHDLKAPLRAVSGFIDLIKEDHQDQLNADAEHYFNLIDKSTARMRVLIDGLLKFSRIGKSSNFVPVDLNAVIEEIEEDFIFILKENNGVIEFENLPEINCLKIETRQLFQNLIGNGLKFYSPGQSPIVKIISVEKEDHWQFEIRDNGIGIAEEEKNFIFNMFGRVHHETKFEGQGLGLAFCKKIVELHKGKIRVESEKGKGSSFFFTIKKNLG